MYNHKKRLFLALMVLALVFVISISLIIWFGFVYDSYFIRLLIWLILALIFSFIIIFSISIFSLVHKIHFGKTLGLIAPLVKNSIKFLYPIVMSLCTIFKIDKDKVKGSFIEINNQLLLNSFKYNFKPKDILILLHHCIQNANCGYKITGDTNNCVKCGNCQISDLIDLSEKYEVKLAVVTGGTCDPLPVMGILNLRPYGPCFNTGVDLERLKESLKFLLKEGV